MKVEGEPPAVVVEEAKRKYFVQSDKATGRSEVYPAARSFIGKRGGQNRMHCRLGL